MRITRWWSIRHNPTLRPRRRLLKCFPLEIIVLLAFIFFSAVGVFLFVAGVVSLRALKQLAGENEDERTDPFFTSVSLLFSTAPRNDAFRRRQRRTVWLFCGSVLMLYCARLALPA